jgi:hypothetical protein
VLFGKILQFRGNFGCQVFEPCLENLPPWCGRPIIGHQWRGSLESLERPAPVLFRSSLVLALQPDQEVPVRPRRLHHRFPARLQSLVNVEHLSQNQEQAPAVHQNMVKTPQEVPPVVLCPNKGDTHQRCNGQIAAALEVALK